MGTQKRDELNVTTGGKEGEGGRLGLRQSVEIAQARRVQSLSEVLCNHREKGPVECCALKRIKMCRSEVSKNNLNEKGIEAFHWKAI